MVSDPTSMMTSIGTGLLVEGVKSAIWRIFGTYSRVRAVHEAFEDPAKMLPPFETALRDVTRVLGSGVGIYTEDVHDLLKELRTSGIISLMAEAALLGVRSYGAEIAFKDLFLARIPGGRISANGRNIDAAGMYDAIQRMLKASLWGQESQPRLNFHSDSVGELRSLFASRDRAVLRSFRPGARRGHDIEPQKSIAPWMHAVPSARALVPQLAQLHADSYRQIWVPGPENRSKTVDIEKIFVPSGISLSTTQSGRANDGTSIRRYDHPPPRLSWLCQVHQQDGTTRRSRWGEKHSRTDDLPYRSTVGAASGRSIADTPCLT